MESKGSGCEERVETSVHVYIQVSILKLQKYWDICRVGEGVSAREMESSSLTWQIKKEF